MLDNNKMYHSISEVCEETELEPHVLRYWETEFPQLRPKKNSAGNRAYRAKDIDIIRHIKRLLYEEQYTIPGAKKKLLEDKDADVRIQMSLPLFEKISETDFIRHELRDILDILKNGNSSL